MDFFLAEEDLPNRELMENGFLVSSVITMSRLRRLVPEETTDQGLVPLVKPPKSFQYLLRLLSKENESFLSSLCLTSKIKN